MVNFLFAIAGENIGNEEKGYERLLWLIAEMDFNFYLFDNIS